MRLSLGGSFASGVCISYKSAVVRARFLCLALILVTVLAYWPVRQHGFLLFDDPEYITQNRTVQAGLTWAGVKWAFAGEHFSLWLPLTWLSHMLDCELFGLDAGAHHLVSVVLHGTNAALLLLVLRRLTGSLWPSALTAAFFAWHPLRVESVAWAAERKDVLCTLFWMLTLWAWTGYVERSGVRRPGSKVRSSTAEPAACSLPSAILGPLTSSCYELALLFFTLGLMAKPMIVTLPMVLLLLDFWPLGRSGARGCRQWLRLALEKWPFFALSLCSCAVTFLAAHATALTAQEYPLGLRIGNALVSYARYLGKIFWPADLAILYPLPSYVSAAQLAGAVGLLTGVTWLCWRARGQHPHLAVGWLWFLGTLVPVIGLVQVGNQSMADRFTYIPSIGILLAVAWEGRYWAARLGAGWVSNEGPGQTKGTNVLRMAGLVSGMALAGCLLLTERQLGYWRNDEAVFAHALEVTTDNAIAHINLGIALEQTGRREQARKEYEAALRLNPKLAQAHVNLGNLLAETGEREKALAHYQAGVELKPNALLPRLNLGTVLVELGRFPEAMSQYERAARLDPASPQPRYLMGKAQLRQGRDAEALACFRDALRLDANDVPTLTWLARVLSSDAEPGIRNGVEAVALAERANALTGGSQTTVVDVLGMAYAEVGRFGDARQAAEAALKQARAGGPVGISAALQERLRLYEANRPYRETFQSTPRN